MKKVYRVVMRQTCLVYVDVDASNSFEAQEFAVDSNETEQTLVEIESQEPVSVEEIGYSYPERDEWLDR